MDNNFIILPHQLFDKKYLDIKNQYIIWEHPQYFTKYKYNKKKILLHKASMSYYQKYLKSNGFKVKYISLDQKFDIKNYQIFDPIDKIDLPNNYSMVESPNFLLNKDQYSKYREKTDKFFFNYFYIWCKKELDIIPDTKSQDKHNRKKLPENIDIPKLPSNKDDIEYIKQAEEQVEKEFPDNYGNCKGFAFPITHATAKKWLKDFIKNKFENFGEYEDAIDKDNAFLFHSILSTSINIGLLNPTEIIDEILKHQDKIPLNSLEGYIRQLFWREYQRYCYIYCDFENKNYFGNKSKLTKNWYSGTTGITPIDNCIKNAFQNGYLHHIERLMVIGNFMNLSEISPLEGFKWFMEFACDSYEWVMCQNVLDMVFFVTGGQTMRRPYMSSSNYILKMSNYSKDKWCDIWDKKYHEFIKKNKDELYKYRYFYRLPKK